VSTLCWWRLIIKPRQLTKSRAIAAGIMSSMITYPLVPLLSLGLASVLQGLSVLEAIRDSLSIAVFVLPFVIIPVVVAGALCGLLLANIQKYASKHWHWRLLPISETSGISVDNYS
jgi:hypothetical protein